MRLLEVVSGVYSSYRRPGAELRVLKYFAGRSTLDHLIIWQRSALEWIVMLSYSGLGRLKDGFRPNGRRGADVYFLRNGLLEEVAQ